MTMEHEPPENPTPLEQEAYGWVLRFVADKAGPEDLIALKAWSALSPAHAETFDRASRVWKALDPVRRAQLAALDSGDRLQAASGAFPPPRQQSARRVGRRAFVGGALAASVAAVAVGGARPPLDLWPSWSELAADYRTDIGEQRRIALSGTVSVDLNTRTSIARRSAADAPDGFELIAGEAMVAVSQTATPLTVLVADGRVVAAKARFNLRYDGTAACVTCLDGEVRVEHVAAALPLTAGRQVVFSPRGLEPATAINSVTVTAWMDGIVIFDATPISDVIAEVNRYRPGKIILTNANLGHERLSARFRIENIGRVVGQIEQVFGARARTLPGGITLLG